MVYIIDGKPYIIVSSYYKLVEIKKNGSEYIVVPVAGKENRIEYKDVKNTISISIEDYMKSKSRKRLDAEENN